MAFHVYPLNDTKEHDLETSMCKCWPIRLRYMDAIKEFERTGKEDLGLESDYCRKEIAGCDLILKLISA